MGLCGLSLSWSMRILEALFCGLALLIPMSRGAMKNPLGVWCEFVWTFGLIVALVIFLLEKFLCDKIVELVVLQHSWADLTCGISLSVASMLLCSSLIFCSVFVCTTCLDSIFCGIFSIIALVLYTVDAVMAKMKCPSGYLSGGRGFLRSGQALIACVLLAAVTDYFLGVERHFIPPSLVWCIVVYVVCFPVTVVIILIHLIKLLGGLLCFALDRMDVIFNIVAVVLYVSAAVVWPLCAYKNYNSGAAHHDRMHDRRFQDLNAATVLTFLNLCLYVADLIWSVVLFYKRI